MGKGLMLMALVGAALLVGTARAADEECAAKRIAFDAAAARSYQHYEMAYCAARGGDADGAFAYLASAAARGYRNGARARVDADFAGLHADPRWTKVLASIEDNQRRFLQAVHPELYALYRADQADRTAGNIDWAVVGPRDKARQQRVKELAAAGLLRHAGDYYHAAMVYQHGDTPAYFEQARAWASRAVELDPDDMNARWLSCAAEDRYLLETGKPQIWGTQFTRDSDGPLVLQPVDESARTDAQRKAMGVASLAETRAWVARQNAKP